ncbi:threonine dehydratase [Beijerinckia indica]|uniref:Pyridoxal-5'-phosphate-dependent protein beta subunit n=1 Tax=Beijerinckia indica subsp. indica (strain ATCC 9039 / DSM 1715 / NCIMB 8712) TaxID=395963 RepID=B2ID21_BEII9|nr:threonine dehydratase [Beijerinckia indica]ACB96786.1 Pyridoxal-5'-phosphate-dependent protein beta subunit [Beijerinckia indica subsp. indica ATCC 9039]
MFDLDGLRAAADLVHKVVAPTPTHAWPLLAARTGAQVFVKHENHTPTGAFKLRGGLTYIDHLLRAGAPPKGLISATRGNHGQSLAFAGRRAGLKVAIVVPEGNSIEKNAAMRAFGAELIESGRDFDAAVETATSLAQERAWHRVPSFHPELVRGVATYALELFEAVQDLDTVYVPIGLGSGICGLIHTRDLLGRKTEIVGVVAANADAYAQSFETGKLVTTASASTLADGMACRIPMEEALTMIRKGAARVVRVEEDEIKAAIRAYHEDTHNLAEGAGAAPLAALLRERDRQAGKRVGLILTGANIDRMVYAGIVT